MYERSTLDELVGALVSGYAEVFLGYGMSGMLVLAEAEELLKKFGLSSASQHAHQMHQPRTLQLHGCGATLNCLR